jgi:hypothetical protein
MDTMLAGWPARPATVTPAPTTAEIRAALNHALDDTLPFEGWEQATGEVFATLAAGVAARATELLWEADDTDPGPQTDPALDRWWTAARETLTAELTPALTAYASMQPDQPLALALRLRRRLRPTVESMAG